MRNCLSWKLLGLLFLRNERGERAQCAALQSKVIAAIGGACCCHRYAADVGVDVDKLYIAQPDAGEQALEIADIMVRSGSMDMVVVDSVAALVPRAEAEGEMGDSHIALQARLMSQALRKITASLGSTHSKCVLLFINQVRTNVGIMFGNPNVTSGAWPQCRNAAFSNSSARPTLFGSMSLSPRSSLFLQFPAGGNALKFYSSVRLEVRKSTVLKDADEIVGHTTVCKVVKNKVAPPLRTATFDMIFGEGVSHEGELLDEGVRLGLVQRSGAWYKLNLPSSDIEAAESAGPADDAPFAQGREKAKTFLKESPEVAARLEVAIRSLAKPPRGSRHGAAKDVTEAAFESED